MCKTKSNLNKGHPRNYSLTSMLSIADTSLFFTILNLSSKLHSLCGFETVPNESQFSSFV